MIFTQRGKCLSLLDFNILSNFVYVRSFSMGPQKLLIPELRKLKSFNFFLLSIFMKRKVLVEHEIVLHNHENLLDYNDLNAEAFVDDLKVACELIILICSTFFLSFSGNTSQFRQDMTC